MNDVNATLTLIGSIFLIVGGVVGGTAFVIRLLKGYILSDFNKMLATLDTTMQNLRDDLNESRIDRKEHEDKLFKISDDHTKEIYNIKGRVKTLEVFNNIPSNDE